MKTQKISRYILIALGILFLCFGLVGLVYGPMEIYCFYLFSPGGPFHYPDFGVGSLWFGYLLVQNFGYYTIAAMFLPLGWGFIKQRQWVFILTKLYLWTWLISGIYFLLNLLAAFLTRDVESLIAGVTRNQVILLGTAAVFVLIVLPALFIKIIQHTKLLKILNKSSNRICWMERTPLPLLGLYLSYSLLIWGLHILIFFQNPIPAFGNVMIRRPSVYVITILVTLAILILFGLVKRNKFAWTASTVFINLMMISTLTSFWGWNLADIFDLMTLPSAEVVALNRLPLLNELKPVVIYGFPLLVLWLLTTISWKYFFKNSKASQKIL